MEDILLRALIFGLIVYFLQGLTEGFQTEEVKPTCNAPDGYIIISIPGTNEKTQCLKQGVDISVKPPTGVGNTIRAVLFYNDSQRITINSGGRYYTATLMSQTLWNTDAGPIEQVFPYSTHNAVLICVSNKLDVIGDMLFRIPQDKWDAVSSFLNSFIYEIPSDGASLTLIPQSAAAAPPLPIEPISAEWLSGMRASPALNTPPPPPEYSGPPPAYQEVAFFEQSDINRGFDMLDANLTQLSYAIKNLFNRSAPPPPPII